RVADPSSAGAPAGSATPVRIADKGAACLTGDDARFIWIGGPTVTRVFAGHSGFERLPATINGSIAAIQPVSYDDRPAIAFSSWYVPGGLTVTDPAGTRIYFRRKAQGGAEN